MGNYRSTPLTSKQTEFGSTLSGLEYGISSMQGWRTNMEDTHICLPSLDDDSMKGVSLFAIFDGHGGSFAAKCARDKFMNVFRKQAEFIAYAKMETQEERDTPEGLELLRKALKGGFVGMDAKMLRCGTMSAGSWGDQSGCTALVVIITPKNVICANAGDSRAVMVTMKPTARYRTKPRTNTIDIGNPTNEDAAEEPAPDDSDECEEILSAVPLSHDHKPTNECELKRIVDAGGYISGKRIEGDLAVSRGFGDFRFKSNRKLTPEKQMVTPIPEVTYKERNNEKDLFLLMGCDGVWNIPNRRYILAMTAGKLEKDSKSVATLTEEVLEFALKKGSKDNMTAILITLPGLYLKQKENALDNKELKQNPATSDENNQKITPDNSVPVESISTP